MWQQRTLKEPVNCTGLGLHSGQPVTITLWPAPANQGVVFRRVDLPGQPEVPARIENVVESRLNTTIGLNGARVMTVEHLLAGLAGMGIDNVTVDLDGPEVPIMDGSAAPFLLLIKSAGVQALSIPRAVVRIKKTIRAVEGDRLVEIKPHPLTLVSCDIEFDHPLLGAQDLSLELNVRSFDREISRARTFGFLEDVMNLKRAGLAKGGSLDNAIVIDRFQVMNPSGLRFEDEFVRHKMLDLIGDLSLLGRPIIGHVRAHKSGHALNHSLLNRLAASAHCWEEITLSPEMSPRVEGPVLPQLIELPQPAVA